MFYIKNKIGLFERALKTKEIFFFSVNLKFKNNSPKIEFYFNFQNVNRKIENFLGARIKSWAKISRKQYFSKKSLAMTGYVDCFLVGGKYNFGKLSFGISLSRLFYPLIFLMQGTKRSLVR